MILIYYDHRILRLLQANQLVGEIGYLRQISWLVKEVQIYLVTCAVTAMGISPTTWLGVNTIPYYSIRPVPTNPKRSTWNWPAPDDIRNSMDPAISGMSCNEQNFRINHKSEKEPLAKIRIQSFRNVILVTSLRMMFPPISGGWDSGILLLFQENPGFITVFLWIQDQAIKVLLNSGMFLLDPEFSTSVKQPPFSWIFSI